MVFSRVITRLKFLDNRYANTTMPDTLASGSLGSNEIDFGLARFYGETVPIGNYVLYVLYFMERGVGFLLTISNSNNFCAKLDYEKEDETRIRNVYTRTKRDHARSSI